MNTAQRIAEILSYLDSDAVLDAVERAEYAERLLAYAKPTPQTTLPLHAPKEEN